ncbi:MAG TPA: ATP-binding protein [Verrucomicrobiae bacterium]|jgi:hypothetical protein|nr:ATP-binding protein [Verrucomicrobiae bacterium]
MNEHKNKSIEPERVAAKLSTAWMLTDPAFAKTIKEEPRLLELLWWFQWLFMQPGGGEKHISQIVDGFAPQFGPACLHNGKSLTFEQMQEVWEALPTDCKQDFIPALSWSDNRHTEYDCMEYRRYPVPITPSEQKLFRALLTQLPVDDLRDAFIDHAKADLPVLIRSFFDETQVWETPTPWYCKKLLAVLFEAMEVHARRVELKLGRTEIVEIVFDRLDYAWSEKRPIKLTGQARTGKSEAIHGYAEAHPGRARVINTPCGISTRDLFTAAAEALGVSFHSGTPMHKIKERVQAVIRHCGNLLFIWDEAQYLLPPPSSSVKNPARLDWVRTNVIDRKLPCALVCTPQTFDHAADSLKKKQYNFDQFLGRIDLNVSLPDQLSAEDLTRAVKIHGAGIPEKLQSEIVDAVITNEKYLSSFEAICCRARHLARRDNNRPITKSDVETAIGEVIPGSIAPAPALPAATVPAGRTEKPVAVRRGRRPTTPVPTMKSPSRQTIPTMETVNA